VFSLTVAFFCTQHTFVAAGALIYELKQERKVRQLSLLSAFHFPLPGKRTLPPPQPCGIVDFPRISKVSGVISPDFMSPHLGGMGFLVGLDAPTEKYGFLMLFGLPPCEIHQPPCGARRLQSSPPLIQLAETLFFQGFSRFLVSSHLISPHLTWLACGNHCFSKGFQGFWCNLT